MPGKASRQARVEAVRLAKTMAYRAYPDKTIQNPYAGNPRLERIFNQYFTYWICKIQFYESL